MSAEATRESKSVCRWLARVRQSVPGRDDQRHLGLGEAVVDEPGRHPVGIGLDRDAGIEPLAGARARSFVSLRPAATSQIPAPSRTAASKATGVGSSPSTNLGIT